MLKTKLLSERDREKREKEWKSPATVIFLVCPLFGTVWGHFVVPNVCQSFKNMVPFGSLFVGSQMVPNLVQELMIWSTLCSGSWPSTFPLLGNLVCWLMLITLQLGPSTLVLNFWSSTVFQIKVYPCLPHTPKKNLMLTNYIRHYEIIFYTRNLIYSW